VCFRCARAGGSSFEALNILYGEFFGLTFSAAPCTQSQLPYALHPRRQNRPLAVCHQSYAACLCQCSSPRARPAGLCPSRVRTLLLSAPSTRTVSSRFLSCLCACPSPPARTGIRANSRPPLAFLTPSTSPSHLHRCRSWEGSATCRCACVCVRRALWPCFFVAAHPCQIVASHPHQPSLRSLPGLGHQLACSFSSLPRAGDICAGGPG
jgi:hypothetical protein